MTCWYKFDIPPKGEVDGYYTWNYNLKMHENVQYNCMSIHLFSIINSIKPDSKKKKKKKNRWWGATKSKSQ